MAFLLGSGGILRSILPQLSNDILCPQVSIPEKHPVVTMPAYQGHLWHAQAHLKEPANRLMA